MSLKDDLLRNRRVFEMLTMPDIIAEDTGALPRQSAFSTPITEPRHDAKPAKAFEPGLQAAARQKSEIFSLGYGNRASRETGMALSLSPLESIDFPKITETSEPRPSDPLESLYHQLETESRRSSQLLSEEEY